MVDRWVVFVITEFVSAALGFFMGFKTGNFIFMFVGGFFFSLGTFSATRWGFDKWKNKQKPKRRK